MGKPLLTLETLEPDRPTVAIDGVPYELALPDDFGLIESARLGRLMAQAKQAEVDALAMNDTDVLAEAAIDALERLLDGVVGMILRAPDEVRARLNSGQKLEVLAAFGPAVEGRAAPSVPTRRSARTSTSARQSPSSRRRTARPTGTACRSVS